MKKLLLMEVSPYRTAGKERVQFHYHTEEIENKEKAALVLYNSQQSKTTIEGHKARYKLFELTFADYDYGFVLKDVPIPEVRFETPRESLD